MPLYKTIVFDQQTRILVWHISESFQELASGIQLTDASRNRLLGMKADMHRRGFISVRKLLQHQGYSDFDLYYDQFGKPHLNDGKHISITHSFEFSAIAISHTPIGVDIEKQRDKIVNIADKFVTHEFQYLNKMDLADYIAKLTVIWGIKEAIFKIRNEQGISFKDHIKVEAFDMNAKKVSASLDFENKIRNFSNGFEKVENFILVYAFEN